MKTPVVLYAAKSTQDKHLSIPTQLKNGHEKAEEEDGWFVIGGKGVGEFWDEGFSAYSGNRGPDLIRAEEAAELAAREFGATAMLIVQHSDRLARGAGDKPGASDSLVEIWHRLRRKDVHVRSFQNDPMMGDPVLVAVAAKQAFEESERKSKAVSDGMARRRKDKGLVHGGKRRFGYDFAEGGLLVPRQAERVVVERMYPEFIAGASDSRIARGLMDDGIPTALGGKWHQATVKDILCNPLYKGWIRCNGEVVKGAHEAFVTEEEWHEAQDLREQRGRVARGAGRPSAGRHLFRKGMLRCGVCGGALVPRTIRPGKSRTGRAVAETYICYERSRHPDLCSMPNLERVAIDSSVYSYFEQVGLDVEATRKDLSESRDRKLVEVRALFDQAQADQQRTRERLARVRRDYMDDKLSAGDWKSFSDELGADQEGADAEVDRLAGQLAEIETWGDLRDAERDTLAKLADLRRAIAGEINDAAGTDAVRAALARLFKHFVVRRIKPGMRVHAELAWQGDHFLDPVAREQAVEGYTNLRPVFVREQLYVDQTNQASPKPWLDSPPLFGPILISTSCSPKRET